MIALFVVVWFGSLGIAGEMEREEQQIIAESK
jgi:hypothetical protein